MAVNQGVAVELPGSAGTVFVAEPEIASFHVINHNKILVFGRLPGQTSLFAFDESGASIYSADVTVKYDTVLMREALRREFPALTLKLTPVADGIIVSGDVPSAEVAAGVIALLDSFVQVGGPGAGGGGQSSSDSESQSEGESSSPTGAGTGQGTMAARNGRVINRLRVTMPTQVTIRVRVAEVNRNLSEKLGFKWQFDHHGRMGEASFLLGLAETPLTTSLPFEFAANATRDFVGIVDALATENMVSILAEPNLTVASGESASFLAGGQMPFPVSNGNDDVSIEFRDFGVLLSVTPTIISPQRISLRLRPEVSEPSSANGIIWKDMEVPGFVVRRTETTVELASGQSFAIAGLLQSSLVDEINKIPGLGDIPILGALARSSSFARGETELVVIATAYIVEPGDQKLRLPNANIYVPGAFSRFFLDRRPDVKSGDLKPMDLVYF
ncbi:MAG: pilus assembly protein N-terminal domain-containing protein [Candidatus Adiutrix sp.]|nr:pilus assembly protein N-terminal domain-containing protein [Candidatus Adiutrix sp.]